ncbi:MAG: DUF362 domain-containing protein [Candidatus Thorarchaeota archaeon]|nr:MAG: DUF362 domain-containing protein [Candidatus Thorarchaeota archaeon]
MKSETERASAKISRINDLKRDMTESLEHVAWRNHVKSDSTIFVKPNFTYPYYKEGITTNPEMLRCLLGLLKNQCRRIIVGESDGGYRAFSADQAFEGHNMHEICRDTGAELINLSKIAGKEIEDTIQGRRVKVRVPQMLLDQVDCFVDVPVLKVHVMTGVTLSIKNLWGCNPDTMRCLEHKHLDYKLALLTKALKPRLIVVDGIHALDGHGPMYGESKRTDLIICSNNPVLADSLGAAIMGIPLSKARHVLLANKEGLGPIDLTGSGLDKESQKFQMHFHIDRTLIDRASIILFNNEIVSKVVMDSPFTPMIYRIASIARNSEERIVSNDLERFKI